MANEQSTDKKSVAVLGGGISGLAGAFYLCRVEPKLDVHLYEASERVGGVLETLHTDGYLIERGADNFATLIPDALELSQRCGLEETLIQPRDGDRRAFVLSKGKLHPIPAGFSLMQPTRVWSVLTTPTLSLSGKLRLLSEVMVARRDVEEDESLESFVTRRLGREAFEALVEPIVSGIFTADPTKLSMQATMPQFVEMERRHGGLIRGHLAAKKMDAAAVARKASGARYDQFMAPRQGMSSWIEGVAASLPADCIETSVGVQQMQSVPDSDGRWRLHFSNGTSREFDAVVCSLPASVTSELLSGVCDEAAAIVAQVPYASSAVVAMIVNKRDVSGRIDGFGAICPSREKRRALAISYTSNKYPGRTPEDEVLLRVFLGGAMQPEIVDLSDGELETMAEREVRDLLGWTGRKANWQGVIRWRDAMPQYHVGHMQRMKDLDELLTPFPSLKLCGAAYRGVGIPQCVRGARLAADAIAKNFGGREVDAEPAS